MKVDGERAYDLARDGVEMDLAARPLVGRTPGVTARPDADHADLEMVCGKGGYVRAIARDLGAALGCLGHVAWLRRDWSGPFAAATPARWSRSRRWPAPGSDAACCRWNWAWPICRNCSPRPKARPGCATAIRAGAGAYRLWRRGWASLNGRPLPSAATWAANCTPTGCSTHNPFILVQILPTAARPRMITDRPERRRRLERHLFRLRALSLPADPDLGSWRRPKALFVMLNPSTATEVQNDPTVERCERRARALGFGAFRVTNIFAFRATDPRVMRAPDDPVGPGNDAAIADSAGWADRIICAWGTHGAHLDRGAVVETLLRGTGQPLFHLGLSQAGHPTHPLYIPYSQAPVACNPEDRLSHSLTH